MKNKNVAYLYLLVVFFAWGSLYVASKFVLGKIPTLTVAFFRYFIASITLALIMRNKPKKKLDKRAWKYVVMIGFFGYFLSISAQLIGTKYSNASLASLINSMNPVIIMISAAIILKEKLTLKKIFCIILAVIGTYIVIGGVDGEGQIVGILFSIFSVTSWGFVSIAIRKVTQEYNPLQITLYGMIVAMICLIPCSAIQIINTPNIQVDFTAVLALIYMGTMCTAVAHLLWNKSLSMLEAGTCSLFYPLQPFTSVLLGSLLLGEKININFIFGSILIILGIMISILKKKRPFAEKTM